MKRLLLLMTGVLLSGSMMAQIDFCEADDTWQDSLAGVYPLPYDEAESPDGGIQDSACLNKDYQFVFTAVINDTLQLGDTPIPIDYLELNADGSGVVGLPVGMDFACNPPNCLFEANTIGCVVVYGKATDVANLGDNELTINAKVYGPFFPLGFDLSFPNPQLYPGTYSIYVHEEDYENCSEYVSSAQEQALSIEQFRNVPNPFIDQTMIEVVASEAGSFQFEVTDLMGKRVHLQQVRVEVGANQIQFDGSNLSGGIYLYSLYNESGRITKKMVVSK